MDFSPPANQDDLSDRPIDRDALLTLWNRQRTPADERSFYMGDYVMAAARNPNYVDPRQVPPSGTPSPVPWNGFPRLLSRFYNDQASEAARAQADAIADVPTPWLYWVAPGQPLNAGPPHQLPFFARQLGVPEALLRAVAGPLHAVNADGTIGDPIPQFRRQQDEYLEWHADRNADGTIRRICFTAEPPDYWEALAEVAPDRVLTLYQQHVNPSITRDALFYPDQVAAPGFDANGNTLWRIVPWLGGTYNPLNRWTTTDGIMHLTHRANTLGAEVNLAGDASVPRSVDSQPRTPGQDPTPQVLRIACGAYGGINRSSDPNIGLVVGDLVKDGNRVTLTDPVGLYIGKIDLAGLRGPNGEVLESVAGRVVRGSDDPFEPRILRYEVELPSGTAFTLSDCSFDNRPLLRGGQIARETTIRLYANVYPNSATAAEDACRAGVCRSTENDQLFLIGDPTQCPPPGHPFWLLATPYEGDTGGAMPGVGELEGAAIDITNRVSAEEAHMPEKNVNPYKLLGF